MEETSNRGRPQVKRSDSSGVIVAIVGASLIVATAVVFLGLRLSSHTAGNGGGVAPVAGQPALASPASSLTPVSVTSHPHPISAHTVATSSSNGSSEGSANTGAGATHKVANSSMTASSDSEVPPPPRRAMQTISKRPDAATVKDNGASGLVYGPEHVLTQEEISRSVICVASNKPPNCAKP